MPSFFDRSSQIAGPGFSRWLVPPAALAIHLCIGQAYAFSTFNLPMTKLIGITQSAPDDWTLTQLGWIFSIAIWCWACRPPSSAAGWKASGRAGRCSWRPVLRRRLRRRRARHPCCTISGCVYLGYGVLGGCGLGIGYISPVSTLIKWFPDRPGMATGMAIMGFGGGALIGAPLSVR
jgi:hypothetical protein